MKNIKNKKQVLIILSIVLICLILGISYAFYIASDEINNNVATTACFKLELTDKNAINIDKAYPISEEEGSKLTPYEFKIKNVCNISAEYQVNLETLNESDMALNRVRTKIDDKESRILDKLERVTEYINNNVKDSRKIANGILKANEEITYKLRLWIDEESNVEETAEKIYAGKVVITSTPKEEVHDVTLAYIVDGETVDAPPGKDDGYKIKNVTCENATGEWLKDSWSINISNITGKAYCDLEFETVSEVEVTLYGGVNEVITVDNEDQYTMDSTGKLENVTMPTGDVELAGSISNQTFTVNVDSEATEVYAMPNNGDGVIYWYGYSNSNITHKSIQMYGNPGQTDCYKGSLVYNTNNIQGNIPSATNNRAQSIGVTSNNVLTINDYNKINFRFFESVNNVFETQSVDISENQYFRIGGVSNNYASKNTTDRYFCAGAASHNNDSGCYGYIKRFSSSTAAWYFQVYEIYLSKE